MILKIEQWIILEPTEALQGTYDPAHGVLPPKSKRKVFHMIDHVEDVKFGDIAPINAIPHPFPQDDGTVSEVEIFMDAGTNQEACTCMMNLIHFRQGGRGPRTIASAGNVYLCNDAGDTIEVIRALN